MKNYNFSAHPAQLETVFERWKPLKPARVIGLQNLVGPRIWKAVVAGAPAAVRERLSNSERISPIFLTLLSAMPNLFLEISDTCMAAWCGFPSDDVGSKAKSSRNAAA
ncbi:hypothetical protein AXF42_Ash018766 [Apostasia shenzhenica]|uniref:Uncharacterized protein n=1 Tax=Apostasia shenzhenica TaxID=1088818 RepID=A0A2I0AJX3_9ASPA|nr:hypothetical protein AXF42_Ash018766 [Apostasia shenzhenica]